MLLAKRSAGYGHCGARDHDRPVCVEDHPVRDACAKASASRPHDHHPRASVSCELDEPRGRTAGQLLAAGLHIGAFCHRNGVVQHSLPGEDLRVETALVVRLAEHRGGATANVDEDDRRGESRSHGDARARRRPHQSPSRRPRRRRAHLDRAFRSSCHPASASFRSARRCSVSESWARPSRGLLGGGLSMTRPARYRHWSCLHHGLRSTLRPLGRALISRPWPTHASSAALLMTRGWSRDSIDSRIPARHCRDHTRHPSKDAS